MEYFIINKEEEISRLTDVFLNIDEFNKASNPNFRLLNKSDEDDKFKIDNFLKKEKELNDRIELKRQKEAKQESLDAIYTNIINNVRFVIKVQDYLFDWSVFGKKKDSTLATIRERCISKTDPTQLWTNNKRLFVDIPYDAVSKQLNKYDEIVGKIDRYYVAKSNNIKDVASIEELENINFDDIDQDGAQDNKITLIIESDDIIIYDSSLYIKNKEESVILDINRDICDIEKITKLINISSDDPE